MSFILILYFMGTHVAYDLPDRHACFTNANKAADVLARKSGVRVDQFTFQCWPQIPVFVELAARMESGR